MSKLTSKPGDFCWNELATSDTAKSKDFYSSLFGWKTTDHKMGDMTYTMFNNGDTDIGGMYQIPAEKSGQIPPNWMGYVLVASVEETLKKAESLQATVVQPITSIGEFGQMAIIKDPAGAVVALWQQT